MAIPNRYKDTLYDFIDSSNLKFSDWLGLIDKRSHNKFRSKDSLADLMEEDYWHKDVSNRSSWLALKIKDFQVCQHYDVAPFGLKSGRVGYKKS